MHAALSPLGYISGCSSSLVSSAKMLEDNVFLASREGNLTRLKLFVERDGQDINVIDDWDATPLYYASLCGHIEVVKYLLERGARCEPNTFDGERCFYAALSDDIRRVLHSYQAANKQRGPLFVYTFRIFNNERGGKPDFCFRTSDGWSMIYVHRWLLSARSSYFAKKLRASDPNDPASGPAGPWASKASVYLSDPRMNGQALHAVLSWLYTERLMCPVSRVEAVKALARNCRLPELQSFLATYTPPKGYNTQGTSQGGRGGEEDDEEAGTPLVTDRILALDLGKPYKVGSVPVPLVPHPLRSDGEMFSRQLPLLVPTSMPVMPVPCPAHSQCWWEDTQEDQPVSAEDERSQSSRTVAPRHSLRGQVWRRVLHGAGGVVPPSAFDARWDTSPMIQEEGGEQGMDISWLASIQHPSPSPVLHHDLTITVASVPFYCHTSVVAARSKYIESLLHFTMEQRGSTGSAELELSVPHYTIELSDMSPPAFAACCEWMYCDVARPLSPRLALETLAVADQLLLQEMKPALVAHIIRQLGTDTLTDAWRMGEQLGLQRLSESCALFSAQALGSILALPDFTLLTHESAATIANRQDYDSVPVLDEIKAAIRQVYGSAVVGQAVEVARGYNSASSTTASNAQAIPMQDMATRDVFGMRVTVLHALGSPASGSGATGSNLTTMGRPVARHLWRNPSDGAENEEEEEAEEGEESRDAVDPGEWDPRTSDRGQKNTFKADDDVVGHAAAHVLATSTTTATKVPEGAGGQAGQTAEYYDRMAQVDAFAASLGYKTRR